MEPIVMNYLLTYLIPNIGLHKIQAGPLRELKTIATTLDLILSGSADSAGDTLLQRFKAIEMALHDNSWKVAKHLELVVDDEGSSNMREREMATREAVREGKLAKHLEKEPKDKKGRGRSRGQDED